ncbi:TolC family protein [Dyadobacter sp. 50-39]|uniref:TolC family protein n=1 Tax=Dyadobacter sp. 50-39 TaxID=1895756 RepID=UPI000B2F1E2B|nr:TolC family protein [Dyadobacter sp. 50-39]
MHKYIVKIMLAAVLCSQQAVSQQMPKVLSLDEAINRSVETYPSIRAKLAEIQASESEAVASRVGYSLPAISFQAQALYATSNQVRGTFFPNEGTAIPTSGGIKVNGYTSDAVWSSFSTLLGSYKLVNFGKKKADETVSKARIEQANADYERELFEHKVEVADAYLLTLVFQDAFKVQQKNFDRIQAFYNVIHATAAAGLRPGVDSSMAAAEVSKASVMLLESQKVADQQKIRLAELLGGGSPNYELVSDKFNATLPVYNVHNIREGNPLLKFYEKRIGFSMAKTQAIRKSYLPSIMARGALWSRGSGISDRTDEAGNFNYSSSLSGLKFRAYDYMTGLTTLWNISDVFRTKQQARSQQYLTESYQQQFNEVRLRVDGQMQTADLQYASALKVVEQAPVQLSAAQAAYAQADARYQAGLSTVVELTQSIALLNRAEIDQIVAHNNVWRALLQKLAAVGDITDFLNQAK